MTFISLNAPSRGLSIVAGLFCFAGVLSYVKADDRAKPLALNIAVGAGVLAVGNQLISQWCEDLANYQLKEITTQLEKDRDSIKHDYQKQTTDLVEVKALSAKQSEQLVKLAEELQAKDTAVRLLQDNLGRIKAEFEAKGRELDAKLQQDDTRFEDLLDEFKGQLAEDLSSRIYKTYNQLSDSVEARLKREDYRAIHPNLQEFFDSLEPSYNFHCSLVNEITTLDGTASEILTNAVDIYHQVSDEIAALKVRFRNLLNVDERRALDDAYTTLADYSKKFTPIDKAKGVLNEYRDFQKEQLEKLYGSINENQNSLDEMRSQVGDLLNQLDAEHLKIAQLNQQIIDLKKPLKWSLAQSRELQIGNLIIEYFWQTGVYLDRTHSQGDVYSVKLYFQIDRNSRAIAAKELNEHSEALQTYCRTLKPVVFTWDGDIALMSAEVVLKDRPKKDSTKDEIDSIWIPAKKFETYVKRWERVRITAGSTGGKSPTAKNLALAIMKSRKGQGEIRLYDPQHGSKKDFWEMPKAGTTHEDNVEGMKELCDLLDQRTKSRGNHPFVLYIFDEIDSTIAKYRSEAYTVKDLVVYSLSQGSHQDLGVIYIGQSADANTIPGMSHSQWNNAIQLHIGSNAGVWLDKATTVTSEDKTKLLNQYRKIQEFCERMNEELGLDIYTDATAYRFALAVPLTGLPKFIQLPPFDSYDYQEVMGTDVKPTSTTSQWVEIQSPALVMPTLCCPHCRRTNIKKNGKDKATKTIQQYKCNDCGKGFSELDVIPNSN
ncbi:hypothetical protein [Scytonema sp. PCC 10023]|uniref:IS1/IS1595 family N-terminal zinc-binding domain-containing protein n=1 Tax=Scytonema sp. PCC 10023 TaxID=1680591 RepID=UPI0039C6B963